jgi:hypothetical protein
MHSRLLSVRSSQHLQSWDRYRETELTANKQLAVTDAGDLLEYETLVSRLLPPNVNIDNDSYEVGLLTSLQSTGPTDDATIKWCAGPLHAQLAVRRC